MRLIVTRITHTPLSTSYQLNHQTSIQIARDIGAHRGDEISEDNPAHLSLIHHRPLIRRWLLFRLWLARQIAP